MSAIGRVGVAGALLLGACQTNGVLGDPCAAQGNCPDDDSTDGTSDDGVMSSAGPTTPTTASPDTGVPPNPSGGPTMTTSVPDEAEGDPDPSFAICLFNCAQDSDCTIMGTDIGLACSQVLNICMLPCQSDVECWAVYSGWTQQPCTSNADCFSGPCVDYEGTGNGGCATDANVNDCTSFMQEEIPFFDVDGNEVLVCASLLALCDDYNGERTCVPTERAPQPTCDDLMCSAPLTCDEAEPSCNCTSVDDCIAAGFGNNPFDGGEVDCRAL